MCNVTRTGLVAARVAPRATTVTLSNSRPDFPTGAKRQVMHQNEIWRTSRLNVCRLQRLDGRRGHGRREVDLPGAREAMSQLSAGSLHAPHTHTSYL